MESNQIFEIDERGVLTKYHEREEVQEITTADGVAEIHIRLTQITIPKGVVEIGAKAFEECLYLKNVVLPDGIKKIGPKAFYKCKKLEKINLVEGLEILERSAFEGCLSLKEIEIPDTVYKLSPKIFKECRQLSAVKLPYGIKVIPRYFFDGCNIKKVEIPDTVETIGAYAFFKYCNNGDVYS